MTFKMGPLRLITLIAYVFNLRYVCGQTSLYIPGFDPQPLSASELGVGLDGRTTWELVPGEATGTFETPAFIGTAILVEGPTDAVLSYSDPAVSFNVVESCAIDNSIARCAVVVGGSTAVQTETASPIVVQGGGMATTSTPATTTSVSSERSSAMSSGPSQASQTQKTSSGTKISWNIITVLGGIGVALVAM